MCNRKYVFNLHAINLLLAADYPHLMDNLEGNTLLRLLSIALMRLQLETKKDIPVGL